MTKRLFSPKCSECRQKTMVVATVPYSVVFHHDGREYAVQIPDLEVPKCSNCGAISLDAEANVAIDLAFRRHAGLLTPEQILQGRKKLGLDQQQFADLFGVAVSTISRWETGAQIQQRVMDGFLKAVFEIALLREFLGNLHGVSLPQPVEGFTLYIGAMRDRISGMQSVYTQASSIKALPRQLTVTPSRDLVFPANPLAVEHRVGD